MKVSKKVKLAELEQHNDLLKSLLNGMTDNSKNIHKNIKKQNLCFQMTLFGSNVMAEYFIPTFKY